MNLPPLKSLPAFIAVARHLSFSKAAENLHVTHSAISQSIKLLEEFLGHPLFIRKSGKVFLSDAGKAYYSAINNALGIIEEATRQQLGESADNLLTLNVSNTLTMRWLIPRLPNFAQKHPQIDLRLSTLTSEELDFTQDNIDLAIVYGYPEDWPDHIVEKLFDDKLVLVASPKLIKKIEPQEKLFKTLKAIYVTAKLRKFDWKQWCDFFDLKEPNKKQRIYFQNTAQALQAAVSGIGMIVSHEPFITDDIKSNQLIYLSKKKIPLTKSYYLIYPKKSINNKKIQTFKNWLLKQIQIKQKKQ